MVKVTVRNCFLYLTGVILILDGLLLEVMIWAKSSYDQDSVQILPFNALTSWLYLHWTTFQWVWPWLPEDHSLAALLSIQSVFAIVLMLGGAGVISAAKIGFTDIWQVHSEQRKERLRGISRVINAIGNIVAGRDVNIAQGNSSRTPYDRHNPSESLGAKLLIGILVPVCVAALLMLLGLHPKQPIRGGGQQPARPLLRSLDWPSVFICTTGPLCQSRLNH